MSARFVRERVPKMNSRLFCLALFLASHSATAADLPRVRQALDTISEFADDFCRTPALEGGRKEVELSGSAKAELNALLKKVADLGVEGVARYQTDEYRGLLQKDLANVVRDASNCRLEVWRDLKDKLVPTPSPSPADAATGNDASEQKAREQALIERLKRSEEEKRRLEAAIRLAEAEREAQAALHAYSIRNAPATIDADARQVHTLALLFREGARAEEIDAYLDLCVAGVGMVVTESPGSLRRIRSLLDAAAQIGAGSNVGHGIQGETRKQRLFSFADLIRSQAPLQGDRSVEEIRRQALRYPSLTFR